MDFKRSVGYLLHELSQQLTIESDQVLLERFGIGFSQLKVLLALESSQGIPQKEIARVLCQSEASVSRQIGVLIDKDLVEIGPSKDNRRHLIYLTSKGEELCQRANAALNRHLAPYFEHLTDKQLINLSDMLRSIKLT